MNNTQAGKIIELLTEIRNRLPPGQTRIEQHVDMVERGLKLIAGKDSKADKKLYLPFRLGHYKDDGWWLVYDAKGYRVAMFQAKTHAEKFLQISETF